MPVDAVHGAAHVVIVCQTRFLSSELKNVSFLLTRTRGMPPGFERSPGLYVYPAMLMRLVIGPVPVGSLRGLVPPWLSFSGRCPCVTSPLVASFAPGLKTSTPLVSPGATNAMTMPMFSYQLDCCES